MKVYHWRRRFICQFDNSSDIHNTIVYGSCREALAYLSRLPSFNAATKFKLQCKKTTGYYTELLKLTAWSVTMKWEILQQYSVRTTIPLVDRSIKSHSNLIRQKRLNTITSRRANQLNTDLDHIVIARRHKPRAMRTEFYTVDWTAMTLHILTEIHR